MIDKNITEVFAKSMEKLFQDLEGTSVKGEQNTTPKSEPSTDKDRGVTITIDVPIEKLDEVLNTLASNNVLKNVNVNVK